MKIIIPLLFLTTLVCPGTLWSQTSFQHPSSGTIPITLSAGTYSYYDSGGPNASYANGESGTITFRAASSDLIVHVIFTEVQIEIASNACADVLQVSGDIDAKNGDYCGTDASAPDPPDLALAPGASFESAPGGGLTFTFSSDAQFAFDGWRAIVDVRAPVGCSRDLDCGQTLICENFENYFPWNFTPQSIEWELRTPQSADAMVNTQFSSDGHRSLQLMGQAGGAQSDIALLLGNQTQGRFRLSWNLLLPANSNGQYSVHHREALDHLGFQVRLNSMNNNGAGQLFLAEAPNTPKTSFTFPVNNWASFVHIIDLTKDSAELWVNGQFVANWKFSPGLTGGNAEDLKQLGAVNFSTPASFSLDEVALTETGCLTPCQEPTPCPVLVNGRRYGSQCLACCAGYTPAEWVEDQSKPQIIDFSENREWVDQGDTSKLDISLEITPTDTTLFVDISAIDTIDFRPTDIVLSGYCADNIVVTVEDQRPVDIDSSCYSFNVIWRVAVGGMRVDSLVLRVAVECKEAPFIAGAVYLATNDTLQSGDTLRLTACPIPDTSDFELIAQTCAGYYNLGFVVRNLQWIGNLPANQQTNTTPCFRAELLFMPSQCNIPGPMFTLVVEVRDKRPPQLTPPRDTTIACLAELSDPAKTGRLRLAVDSCGVRDTTYVDNLALVDGCSGLVTRTWRLVDSCGNSVTAQQRIRVEDRIPPTVVAPPAITVNGVQYLDSLQITGTVRNVQDNCGVRDTTFVDDRSGLRGCSGQVRRTWTVTDNCGNTTRVDQLITVLDQEPPRFTVPADRTLDCLDELENLQKIGAITNVSDNVGIRDTVYRDDRSGLNGCEGTVVRTWTVSDSCGNSTTQSQRLRVRDTIPPTFVAPFQVTISCDQELNDLRITGQVLFVSDNCGILDTMYRDSISQVSDCVFRIVRTWTVRDRCGNSTSRTQRIFLADTEPPEFNSPPQARVKRADITNLALTGTVRNVTDNCRIRDTSYTDALIRPASCDMDGWIIRTWRVEDWCGNFSETSQDIFFMLERPVANAGADKTITCRQPVTQLDGTGSSLGGRFTYRWNTTDGNILTGGATPAPTVDAAGVYTLTVRDTTTGCQTTDQAVVILQNDLDPNLVSKTDVLCAGAATGAITIAPRGGNPPYRIQWSGGESTPTLRDLRAGAYVVTVTDNGNCRTTLPVTVSQPDSLRLELRVEQGSRCSGAGTGRASVTVTGGRSPYTITWDNGETTNPAVGLTAGDHSVTVRDANGCTTTHRLRIDQDRPDATLAALPALCTNDAPLLLTGGAPAGGQYLGPGISGGRFNPAASGVGDHAIRYIYVAPNGCADTASTTINVRPLPVLTDLGAPPVCSTGDTVRLNFIQPAGGVYSGQGISNNNLVNPRQLQVGAFPLLYTYRDPATGCANSMATLLTVQAPVNVALDLDASSQVICENELLEVRAVVTNGGSNPAFSWLLGSQNVGVDTAVVRIKLNPGRYTVRGTVTSDLACVALRTATDSITVLVDSVTIEVAAPTDITACNDLNVIQLGGAQPAGGVYSGPFVRNDLFSVRDAGMGVHPVVYSMVDPVTACLVSDTFLVTVDLCTDTETPVAAYSLSVFPNPATTAFRVTFSGVRSGPVTLQLFDTQGRMLRQRKVATGGQEWTETFEVADLPPGLYWLSIWSEQFVTRRKIMIGR